jgi:hypothetical protein
MRRPFNSLTATLVATVALVGAVNAGADGGAVTRISLGKLDENGASGVVRSAKKPCRGDRKVSLFVYDGFITDKIAITYTNGRGRWSVGRSLAPGRYFAKVDAAKGCRYDNSKTKKLG